MDLHLDLGGRLDLLQPLFRLVLWDGREKVLARDYGKTCPETGALIAAILAVVDEQVEHRGNVVPWRVLHRLAIWQKQSAKRKTLVKCGA